jgi:hypothetical protein
MVYFWLSLHGQVRPQISFRLLPRTQLGEWKMKRALAVSIALPLSASMWAQSYNYQTVNYTGDTFTQLLGINNSLIIAGYHNVNQNSGSRSDCRSTSPPKITPTR